MQKVPHDHLGFLLQKCMKAKVLRPGKQIHAQLLAAGLDMDTGALNSKLVGMYAGCGDMISSGRVFDRLEKPDIFAWNWMISAYAFEGDFENAIRSFSRVQKAGIAANKFTFSFVLKACVGLLEINKGKEVHCAIKRRGFESDVSVRNALIDMYCKCGDLKGARRLFDRMPERDVASWTCMISGYAHNGQLEETCSLFECMRAEGMEPNEFTWNAIITAYAQNGDCKQAFELFNQMKEEGIEPDLVTWNAMVTGFGQNQRSAEALELFNEMLVKGLKPNAVTVVGVLPACGSMVSLQKGKQVHGLIYRLGLELNIFTATALIDMYSRCGSIEAAKNAFDQIRVRNVASWNAIIGCYGKHGFVDISIELFERMQEEGIMPNQVTFTSLLSSCSHSGLVEKGLEIFSSMRDVYGVDFSKEHYACVVDLLCRSGRIEEAYELVKGMAGKVTDSVVGAFFNGCRIYGRSDMAKKLADEILQMDIQKPASFVLLSNIYAADGKWEGVDDVRKVMREKGVSKKVGGSWVENKDGWVGFS